MAKAFKPGESVRWKSHGGTAHGTVVGKVTERTRIKGHAVAATPENPEHIVETGTGGRAAHRPKALTKEQRHSA